ncbi:hypothetical protein [Streptomyces sp. WMMB 322]|uniref:hypothetical protein n=1 Tax=Streptomyces sp. WMMB 322 TaxID=1286821 RepID=UPI0006E46D55|nr:hypothetical protein [Streptomyces sp. WMMB 322]SCK08085.1 hypothetical protein H180DRAFT_00339 [Streptomyces sp. WMMB 322]
MGNTSFIVLGTARGDALGPGEPGEPRTQFAELTGAYWLEPIYAGLANEWNRQGRAVPGAPREHRRVLPDGSCGPDGPDGPDRPDTGEEPHTADDGVQGRQGPGTQLDVLRPHGPLPGALDGSRPAPLGPATHE